MERPDASDESFKAALARADAERRWLVVDITDTSKPISWATLYTTWRDPDVVAWLEANAFAIRIDVRVDPEAARALGLEPASAPMVILFRDGKERLRIQGHNTPQEFVKRLERAEIAEGNLALSRAMLKSPERDAFDRSGLADALLRAGLLEEALSHYDWLWCHAVEVDPEMAGVRISFMASKIAELCAKLPAARARFAELRDVVSTLASPESQAGLEACRDYVVLNEVIGADERTLAWLDRLDASQRAALPYGAVVFHLLPLLYERERWTDAGGLVREPLRDLEAILERAKLLGKANQNDFGAYQRQLILDGRPEEAKALKCLGRGLHPDVSALYRSLIVAGRGGEAAEVREAALRFDDSAAMRAALR